LTGNSLSIASLGHLTLGETVSDVTDISGGLAYRAPSVDIQIYREDEEMITVIAAFMEMME